MTIKVFVDLTGFAATADRAALRDTVARLDDAGATGVSVSDHIFYTREGQQRRDGVDPGCDPVTTLAAVAGMSDRLELQTVVMNSAWLHPALLLRHFNQLAVLVGGEKVTVGLGAGWSTEEFDAVGMTLPRFGPRMDRLEEVLRLARTLYDRGVVSADGPHVSARDLPLSPTPSRPPRLLVGGGSDRVLRMAGRYADVLDLHGDPRHGRVAGATMAEARVGDVQRRALTTVDDLAARIGLVHAAAAEAGRPRDAVGVSTEIKYVAFADSAAEVRAAEEELCAVWAQMPYRPLHRSPYLLLGTSQQMADALLERREAYGLERISVSGEGGIRSATPDPLRFCREVLPALDREGIL
jgi:alkanesulfonate monooxygenase SsuD/methylene tetrahydromethanopterin reductase-like flavin-dependent oxidoreductase (luciferase family)